MSKLEPEVLVAAANHETNQRNLRKRKKLLIALGATVLAGALGWGVYELLLASRYGVGAPHRPRTIFAELGEDSPGSADQAMAQVARLSAVVPLFRCRMGNDAYRDSPDALLRALLGVPACVEPAS